MASPRVAARYHFTDWLSVWGDLGWGFRAPTLNELYRQFRVGTVLTLANNQLGPERLVGEGIWASASSRCGTLTWRATWFDNRVKDPVSNVTLTTVGANVTQQRQNLGPHEDPRRADRRRLSRPGGRLAAHRAATSTTAPA